VSIDEFKSAYYAPLESVIQERVRAGGEIRTGGREYAMAAVPELDLRIGLQRDDAAGQRTVTAVRQPTDTNALRFVGEDGVVVQLGESWSADLMRLQPWQRPPLPIRRRTT
jgi:hypothetical protein